MLLVHQSRLLQAQHIHLQTVTEKIFTAQSLYIITVKETLTLSIWHPHEYKIFLSRVSSGEKWNPTCGLDQACQGQNKTGC